MAKIYTSADQLIGGTPLLELTHIEAREGLQARILAKLEYLNPAGSVKDRVALAMIDDGEARGLLKPEIALGWRFGMPAETEADLAAIRQKYMPQLQQQADGE